MDDEITTLIDMMRKQQEANSFGSMGSKQQLQSGLLGNAYPNGGANAQAMKQLSGNASQLAGSMVNQGQHQTQQAMQAKNNLQGQMDSLSAQTQQQAASALQQQQAQQAREQQGLANMIKIGMMIYGGGAGGGAEAAAGGGAEAAAGEGAAASLGAEKLAGMEWDNLLKNNSLKWF